MSPSSSAAAVRSFIDQNQPKPRRGKQRNPRIRSKGDHAASANDAMDPVVPQKTTKRPAVDLPSKPIAVSTPESSSSAVQFDPKSILPDKKPKKSLSKLLEASSSRHKPMFFQCIDGTVRATGRDDPLPETTMHLSRFDDYIASSETPKAPETDDGKREQFTAFGIPAYPTRAIHNDICYDFVSLKRYCQRGNRCFRIHPLDKKSYRELALKECHRFIQMKAAGGKGEASSPSSTADVEVSPKPSGTSHTRSQSAADTFARVRLPRTASKPPPQSSALPGIMPEASSSTSVSKQRTTTPPTIDPSSHNVENWDRITGLHPTQASSVSDSSSSSSSGSGSSGDSDTSEDEYLFGRRIPRRPEDWETSNDPSGWSDATADEESPVRSTVSEKGKGRSIMIQVKPAGGVTTRHALPPKPVVSPVVMKEMPAAVKETPAAVKEIPAAVKEIPAAVKETPPAVKEEPPAATADAKVEEEESVEIVRHPRPRNAELCRWSLNGWCSLGYKCPYVHKGLDYEDEKPEPPIPVSKISESWSLTVHDHIRLRFTSGFEIEDVATGFESNWVFIGNLPGTITDPTLRRLLQPYGTIIDIRRPLTPVSPLVVKVQYAKSSEAYMAYAALHGTSQFGGRRLEMRLAVEGKQNGSKVKDTVVRLDWDYPHRTVYMGYASKAQAEEAVEKAKHILYAGEYQTVACLHYDLPAVGKVTVKFTNLPPNVTQEQMVVFGEHQGMVTERPTYNECTMQDNVNGIRRLCKQFQGTMVDLEFRPPPYREGRMRAWAYFGTAKDAGDAALNLHWRKPAYLGHTRLMAKHIKTISFSVSHMRYQKIAEEVRMLAERVWGQGPGYSLSTTSGPGYMMLRICGEDMRVLGRLKSEVEHILNGEVVVENGGRIAWDEFFARAQGVLFLEDLQRRFLGTMVQVDGVRRTMRLFGAPRHRANVRQAILGRMAVERLRKVHVITLDGRLATALSTEVYERLKKRLGADNLNLDLWRRKLYVRGDEEAYTIASDEVTALRETLPYDPAIKLALRYECPVCFNEASPPIHLPCGHAFCRGCLKRYLLAAIEDKFFPLTCLGDGGKCEERVGLGQAKAILEVDEFNRVVEAAFGAHVMMRPEEFRFCPTPDCQQVYRAVKPVSGAGPYAGTAPGSASAATATSTGGGRSNPHSHANEGPSTGASPGIFIQCPSCLVRICPSCHTDAHDGLSCAEAGDGVGLFQEWAEKHNVKQCPRCRMGIEKEAGCNHMVCTMCKTHICWVCFQTFPNGEGIYRHMHSQHGDFGLGPIE